MTKEFQALREAIKKTWPEGRDITMIGSIIADIAYSHTVSLSPDLHIYVTRSSMIQRIGIRLLRLNPAPEEPDFVNIYLEPGYKLIKAGKVVYENPDMDLTIAFLINGLVLRVERAKTPRQRLTWL